jgi:hypothetical protein
MLKNPDKVWGFVKVLAVEYMHCNSSSMIHNLKFQNDTLAAKVTQ